MGSLVQIVRHYRELAEHYDAQCQPQVRDRFLVLAADAALSAGQGAEAETLRLKLLLLNPHHLLKPYSSLTEALQVPDIKNYIEGLERIYPRASAEQLLASARVASATTPRPSAPALSAAGVSAAASDPIALTGAKAEAAAEPPGPAEEAAAEQKVFPMAPTAVPFAPAPESSCSGPSHAGTVASNFDCLKARDSDDSQGSWVATALFFLLLSLGLALAAYTLARPFLNW